MSVPDVFDALTDYLRRSGEVAALAGQRIYPREMPAAEATMMPRALVVLTPAGGFGGHDTVGLLTPRCDINCYADTPKMAFTLYLSVFTALRSLSRSTNASALLSTCVQGGGPLQGRDADTTWPFVWSSWTIFAGVTPVTS